MAQRIASRPTGQARRQLAQPLEREQHSRDVRLARERVVADRQQLPVAAEQHLLVRDEARAGARSESACRRGAARPSRVPCRTARPASPRCAARRSRRAAGTRRLGGKAHHQHRADREVRREEDGQVALACPLVDRRRGRRRSSRSRTGRPRRARASTLATTASGAVKSMHASAVVELRPARARPPRAPARARGRPFRLARRGRPSCCRAPHEPRVDPLDRGGETLARPGRCPPPRAARRLEQHRRELRDARPARPRRSRRSAGRARAARCP